MFLAGRLDVLRRKIALDRDWAAYYLGLFGNGDAAGWLQSKKYLKLLADYCRANNIRLVIANVPELHDVEKYRFQLITDLVREATAEDGAEFVDLLPYFNGVKSSKLWVTPPDPHPNGYANSIIAEGLFAALQKQ